MPPTGSMALAAGSACVVMPARAGRACRLGGGRGGGGGQGGGLVGVEGGVGSGKEVRAEADAGDVVGGAGVGGGGRGGGRVDGHAADRVDGLAVGMLVGGHARALRPAVSSSAGSVVSAAMIGQVSSGPWPGQASTRPRRASRIRVSSARRSSTTSSFLAEAFRISFMSSE